MRRMIQIIAGLAALAVIALAFWLYTPDKPRAELEATYAAPPSSFLVIDGLRLHIRDTGPHTAPPLILLHGFGASLHTWDIWAHDLEADHRVIRLDLPGFGLTGADPGGDYSDTRAITLLIALMDRLSVPRATIIGNSMGGRIAWTMAATHPDRVAKLVLMAPDGFASPGMDYGKPPKIPAMARLLPYILPRALLRMSLTPAYARPATATDALVTRYQDMMRAPGVRTAILDRMRQNILIDPEPLLRQIQAPTLLLWGDKDAMVPATNAADYLRDLPHASLATLPGIGHLPQEEAPAESLALLRAFLAVPPPL